MAFVRQRPTALFWIVVALLVVWNAFGCYACYLQFRLGPDAMGPATDYDRRLFAAMPGWYQWDYALAVASGLAGALALVAKSTTARWMFIVSLVAVIVMFGYVFTQTDLIAVKGAGATLPFPMLIVAIAIFSIWFTGYAQRRGWIG